MVFIGTYKSEKVIDQSACMQPFEILHICDHVLCEVSEETKSIFSEKTYVEDARTDAIQGNCK